MDRPDKISASRIKSDEGWINHKAAVTAAAITELTIKPCLTSPLLSAYRPIIGAASAKRKADKPVICAQ